MAKDQQLSGAAPKALKNAARLSMRQTTKVVGKVTTATHAQHGTLGVVSRERPQAVVLGPTLGSLDLDSLVLSGLVAGVQNVVFARSPIRAAGRSYLRKANTWVFEGAHRGLGIGFPS
ncbi:MAG: hypothetical protein K2Y37_06680 [Pirellulales bacterium]|nr:hypothetical protein [Pirellulales bacterium]